MSRICITGGPRTGKTTRADMSGGISGPVLHTDALIQTHAWSEASQVVSEWFGDPGPWVIEGVAVPRALRKWLRAHPEGRPCDVVLYLETPRVKLTPGQATMAAGVATVFREIEGELAQRGVHIAKER
jgi:dephospho-CoA kinase